MAILNVKLKYIDEWNDEHIENDRKALKDGINMMKKNG